MDCVIIYAGRIVPCLHWYLIRVIGRMTSLGWFSIWETSNNIINFNDVRKCLWKLIWLSRVFLLEIRVDWKGLYAHSYWRPDSLERVLLLSVDLLGDARDLLTLYLSSLSLLHCTDILIFPGCFYYVLCQIYTFEVEVEKNCTCKSSNWIISVDRWTLWTDRKSDSSITPFSNT